MSSQLLEVLEVPPNEEPRFNSLTPEGLAQLEALFHQQQDNKAKALRNSCVVLGATGAVVGFTVLSADGAQAAADGAAGDAAAAAKESIASGVTNAVDMIKAIDGIGLAAFGVALAPMGFMTVLRVLNMVLSRV